MGDILHPPSQMNGTRIEVNSWLCSWCKSQGFHFYYHGFTFETPEVLGACGIHPTKWDKSVSTSKLLAKLIRKALN